MKKKAEHPKGVPPSGSGSHPPGKAEPLTKKGEHPKGVPPSGGGSHPPGKAKPLTKKSGHPKGVPPSKKRNRSGTSSEPPREHKRVKHGPRPSDAPTTSYKDATLSHLKVAIIDKDNPYGKIPKAKEVLVKKALTGELDKFIFSTPGSSTSRPPVFRSWTYSGEIVRIVCEDENTLEWLTKSVASLRPWESAALAVVRLDQLPRLTKAALWIPVEPESDREEKEVVVSRLAGQNPTVNVRRWCLFHHEAKEDPRGLLLVFGIGDEDIQILRARSMRLHYLFQSLVLKIKPEKPTNEEVGPPPTTPAQRMETEVGEAERSARIDATSPTPSPMETEVVSPLTEEEGMTK